jgi:hypothetical protein
VSKEEQDARVGDLIYSTSYTIIIIALLWVSQTRTHDLFKNLLEHVISENVFCFFITDGG